MRSGGWRRTPPNPPGRRRLREQLDQYRGVKSHLFDVPHNVPEHAVDALTGRKVWRALGGVQLASIRGHGSYVGPD